MPINANAKVFALQVEQLYKQGTGALFGVTAVSLVTVLLFWTPGQAAGLLLWFGCLLLLSLVRLWLLLAYRRRPQALSSSRWANHYLLLEFVSGFVWSGLMLWAYPQDTFNQALVLLILGAMSTGASPMLAPVLRVYVGFLFNVCLVTVLVLFRQDEPYSPYLATFTLIYSIALLLNTAAMNRRIRDGIGLSIENQGLVESLQLTNKQLLKQVSETQEAETRFRTLANATNEGVVLYANQQIIDANERILAMLGYSEQQLLQLSIEQLFVPADRPRVLELLDHNDGIAYELHCLCQDGSNFTVELRKRRMPLAGNRIYVFTLRDITEFKHMAEIKDQFLSNVSHELRTPITSIHASLAMLLGGVAGSLSTSQQPLLDIAFKNSERLNTLINDLLDMQKMDSGRLLFEYEDLDARQLMQQIIELNRAYMDKHSIGVRLLPCSEGLLLHVDRNRFIQVLTNLLSNAAKFSPAGSEIEVGLVPQDGLLQIHIRDQGPGIPDDFREQIFQRFSQADGSTSRAHGGSGLGLYISKQLLLEMRGDIDFHSQPGQGTTFIITLPLVKG